jgi:aryl-alcohol dehydrogenase-like predicted oxidoreductase
VSINDYQSDNALDLVRSGHVDTVQVIYNAFHQAPEERLLPACARHGVGVIVRVALDEGGLTGRITPDTRFPDGDFRNSYFGGNRKAQVKQHVDALAADLGIEPDQVAEVALRYVLSQDAVSTAIVGMRTVRNVERNAAVGDGRGLSAERQAIVAKHRWERNFYES